MTDSRVTDERLRSYLNNRQPDRERMCAAILAMEPGYSRVETRRPDGGPDQGRDIQSIFNGNICYGAVGFKNSANDTSKQVREIIAKFKADLDSALAVEPKLKAFVFFTNVDLSPTEQIQLKAYAIEKSIRSVEVYPRERIRLLLDRAEGFAIRLSFLDLPLTDAEQKVFFSRFGKELQNLISGRLDSIEERLEEIQFVNWTRGRCRSIVVHVFLKRVYDVRGDNHEPYRFALLLQKPLVDGQGEILLGCYSVPKLVQRAVDFERKQFAYVDTEWVGKDRKKHIWLNPSVRMVAQPFKQITFSCGFGQVSHPLGIPGIDVAELGQYCANFYCDDAWASKVDRVEVWFDEYLVHELQNREQPSALDSEGTKIHDWPAEAEEVAVRPYQRWRGWSNQLNQVCRRRRVGEQ